MTPLRQLDHVAVVVRDTEHALAYFAGRLGLQVVSTEVIERPHVRLTYLDAGGVFVQLVEPLDDASPVAQYLAAHGEGLHHIAFAVADVPQTAAALADPGAPEVAVGSGRGRPSAFVPGDPHHGVRVEVTQADVAQS
ncbi:MAG TPA: VOC family protein [Solirubrobacteraceae bacterium]|jgi:methylmalonyl-CoA/ethylmalonyl-CoA epimerase